MRTTVAAVAAIAAAVALAACSNDRDSTPLHLVAPGARAADVIPTTCDITTINQDGRAYFTSSRDLVFDQISTLKTDLKNFGIGSQTTADVFNILKRVATVRLTSAAGGAAAGGTFVDAVLACTSFAGAIPTTFNASASLGSGIFEVSPSAAVQAFVGTSGGNRVAASPRWGAEPAGTNGWPGGTYLVYGYPTAGVDPTNGFELGTLPVSQITASSTLTNPINVGICAQTTVVDNSGKPIAAKLLVHNGSEVLPLVKLAFCSQTASASAPTSWFAALTNRLTSYFTPALAYAQDGGDTFIGGLPSGWSPFQPQVFTASSTSLAFTQQPVDTKTSAQITVTVTATPATGSTLPPLNVRLTIAGNNGTPAFFNVGGTAVSFIDATAVSNGDGTATATFTFGFTKAGGYTLGATGFIGGGAVGTAPVISNLFQVQNK